ncbi:DUF3787 domain-containing protein [Tissierella pigra]|uniref:DUF3787 domain-containing protein n=1 Tax=Tissierella pigra TaxID=2607614 RepID=A0A6N7Y3Z6_9FIRM|nr:DUF3787 domain-containing protein [Tissierella pigra]MBU5427498.1 DUF3787 domain-containing protein [Tissierella pigra]MSU03188.1 DUF3787 domain-containing protein [Tissierella pigra]
MKKDKRSLNAKTENLSSTGTYKNHRDPHFGYSPTDIYYDTEEKIPESKVSIPTYDAVVSAKEWVDDVNKK